jgi:uncharacterized protein YecT (DUF1311 family)
MRPILAFTLFAFPVLAQAPVASRVLSIRAGAYLHAEGANKKADRCNTAKAAESTASATECIGNEYEKTRANYVGFVRALGALLRLDDDGHRPKGTPQRISFDQAESAWLVYLDKTCDWGAKGYSTWGPAVVTSCQITLTENHMAELRKAYADAFQ